MVKLEIKGRLKESGEFVQHKIQIDDKIRQADNDELYDFIADFMEIKHKKPLRWFRFWTID